MQRTEVSSGQIRSIGYDEAARTLEVEFTSGGVYVYRDVPPEAYQDFMNADSKGRYFAIFVRANYEYERLHAEGCGKYLDCKVVNCVCFCHAKKEVKREIPNPNLEKELKASIKAAKAKKRQAS